MRVANQSFLELELTMSECQMCHCEDAIPSFVPEVCEDCYDEMKMESQAAGQDFYEYWEIDNE